MDREKCMKIVIEQLNQIKPLMSIDPEVSLLGDKYNFDSNDIILFCLQLKKHFDIDLGSFIKKADRKSTRLNSSHIEESRMPSSA